MRSSLIVNTLFYDMSLLQPVPQSCVNECSDVGTSGIPGPIGNTGADGIDGTDGVNAFTTVANYLPAAQPQMPDGSVAGTVTVNTTSSTGWMALLQIVFVQNWGWMQVVAIPSDTSVELLNLEDGSGAYDDNAPAGTFVAAGSRIVPGGRQGVPGIVPGGALLALNNLSDLDDVPTARGELGLGTAALVDTGVASGEVAPNDGALTAGEVLFASATGIETVSDATARTNLGLGTMAVQASGAVAISGGAIDNTPIGNGGAAAGSFTTLAASGAASLSGDVTATAKVFTPSTAIQSLLAANTISPNAALVRVAGNGGAVVLVSTPTITNPAADGQRMVIMGTSDANTVELQDKSTLGGSNLNLAGNANVVLGEGDVIDLIWQSTLAGWYEVSRSLN